MTVRGEGPEMFRHIIGARWGMTFILPQILNPRLPLVLVLPLLHHRFRSSSSELKTLKRCVRLS